MLRSFSTQIRLLDNRILPHLIRAANGDDAPAVQDHDAVALPHHQTHIVLDHHNSHAVSGELVKEPREARRLVVVLTGRRLVQQKYPRSRRECTAEL